MVLTRPESGHVDHALHAHRLGTLADLFREKREREKEESGDVPAQSAGRGEEAGQTVRQSGILRRTAIPSIIVTVLYEYHEHLPAMYASCST